jgi:hypothetical protein
MINLVACSFATIDLKLGVTPLILTKLEKTALGQKVEGFHMVSGGTNAKQRWHKLVKGKLLY